MRNALLITLGVAMLAVVGFAGTHSGEPAVSLGETTTNRSPANTDLSASRTALEAGTLLSIAMESAAIVRELEVTDKNNCGPTVATAGRTDDDPCVDCLIGCFEEFRTCRQACGPIWDIWEYLACFDDCVTDEIACEESCGPLCLQLERVGTKVTA